MYLLIVSVLIRLVYLFENLCSPQSSSDCLYMIIVFTTVFQEDGRLNMVLPGSLQPFKKEICNIFRLEKAKFISNPRFHKIFAKVDIKPVFSNRPNLKKLLVRTKIV